MIIGEHREEVIDNIRIAVNAKNYNTKVEIDDPIFSAEERKEVLDDFVKKWGSPSFKMKSFIARQMANAGTSVINRYTKILGIDNIKGITGGAIITSNHFSQIDNTIIRKFAKTVGKKRLYIISQDTNLIMKGLPGFLMNYADILPISLDHHYLGNHFEPMFKELLRNDEFVLVYPEEEMWFNYRKPRPPKQGAYYYSAKFDVPIISCFVEIRDLPEKDNDDFNKVEYTLHILDTIYPDPQKTIRENRREMSEIDFKQKQDAYETIYNKQLGFRFTEDDIAGWNQGSKWSEQVNKYVNNAST